MDLPEAVLFDLGDTLISPGRIRLKEAAEAVLAFAIDRRGVTAEQAVAEGERLVPIGQYRRRTNESGIEYPAAWFLRTLLDSLGLRFDVSPLALEQAYWRGAYPDVQPVPGIEGFLDVLADRGIPTAVVSNASFRGETLERELARQGLRDRLGFVMSSADYGLRKPNPLMLEVALTRLGVAPEHAWYCGDRQDWDVRAARAAGMTSVWLEQDGVALEDPPPDIVLRHWDEMTARFRNGTIA